MMEPRITQEALDDVVEMVAAMPKYSGIDFRPTEARSRKQQQCPRVADIRSSTTGITEPGSRARENGAIRVLGSLSHVARGEKADAARCRSQLDGLTDDILDRLRDPETDGAWDRRGLVVGDVQSGKTVNYTGLICKAVDAGYPLVIVLAGVHNSLRSQTQLRLDEGFLGFRHADSICLPRQKNQRIGAGALPGAQHSSWLIH